MATDESESEREDGGESKGRMPADEGESQREDEDENKIRISIDDEEREGYRESKSQSEGESEVEEPQAICYPDWTPPPFSSNDLVDIEKLAEEIKKKSFKTDNRDGVLYDETGRVNLPVDAKEVLEVDLVSRTRIEDIFSEFTICTTTIIRAEL